jgi:hypothetical protein
VRLLRSQLRLPERLWLQQLLRSQLRLPGQLLQQLLQEETLLPVEPAVLPQEQLLQQLL